MNSTELLTQQTKDAYDWCGKLINSIPMDKWDVTPEIIESNISWQIGHLIMSHYFHSVMCIAGHQKEVLENVSIKEYNEHFTKGNPKLVIGNFEPNRLIDHLKLIQNQSLKIIQSLSDDNLNEPLVPTQYPNPVANTKYEAIDWNIKHTMWHCGQLGLIKRVVDERMDFGLT